MQIKKQWILAQRSLLNLIDKMMKAQSQEILKPTRIRAKRNQPNRNLRSLRNKVRKN
jgi:hypothetical protein